MDDIVERLRSYAGKHVYESHSTLELAFTEAADEIVRLREALQQIKFYRYDNHENAIQNFNDLQNIARAALKEGE